MWSLIHTQPKRSAFETRSARPTFWVHNDEARPYGVPLAHLIASCSSVNGWTVITGPKISRWIISSSWRRPPTTVGSRKKPGRSGCLHRRLHVGVVEDDDGRLAAELEVDLLERVRAGAGDPLARLHRPGERHHAALRGRHPLAVD